MKAVQISLSLSLMLMINACGSSDFAANDSATQSYNLKVADANPATSESATDTSDDTSETATGEASDPEAEADRKECASLTGITLKDIKVSGSKKDISLGAHEAFAVRVTGNKNKVHINLADQLPTSSVKAICIFIAGNQNQVTADIANHVEAFHVRLRGNKSSVSIASREGSVIDSIKLDSKGNSGKVTLSGEGQYPCDKADESFSCPQ